MSMPKLGPSLAAAGPAVAKVAAMALDERVLKATKEWQRAQDYAVVVTGGGAIALMAFSKKGSDWEDYGRSVWDGSIAIFSEQVLTSVYNRVLGPAAASSAEKAAAVAHAEQLVAAARARLNAGNSEAAIAARERARLNADLAFPNPTGQVSRTILEKRGM